MAADAARSLKSSPTCLRGDHGMSIGGGLAILLGMSRQDAVLGGGVRRAGLIFVLAIPPVSARAASYDAGGDRRLRTQ